MCLGGRSSPPPAPAPVSPTPPAASNTVSNQSSPAPTSDASRNSNEEGTTIRSKKKGRSNLVIPLANSSGSGLQY
jgi:hypothetical protein